MVDGREFPIVKWWSFMTPSLLLKFNVCWWSNLFLASEAMLPVLEGAGNNDDGSTSDQRTPGDGEDRTLLEWDVFPKL